MLREEIFEKGTYADFRFVDRSGRNFVAHRVHLISLDFFKNYFETKIGNSDKQEYLCENIDVVKPIIRYIYCLRETKKFQEELNSLDEYNLIEFYKYVDMWNVEYLYRIVYISLCNNIEMILLKDIKLINIISSIVESIMTQEQIYSIYTIVLTQFGDQNDMIDSETVKKILPHLSKTQALSIIRDRKEPELFDSILMGSCKNKVNMLKSNAEILLTMTDDDDNFVFDHKILSKIKLYPNLFHITYSFTKFQEQDKYIIYIIESFYPCIIHKHSLIGLVYRKEDNLIEVSCTHHKIKKGDVIIKAMDSNGEEYKVHNIKHNSKNVNIAYPPFNYVLDIGKNDIEKNDFIVVKTKL